MMCEVHPIQAAVFIRKRRRWRILERGEFNNWNAGLYWALAKEKEARDLGKYRAVRATVVDIEFPPFETVDLILAELNSGI